VGVARATRDRGEVESAVQIRDAFDRGVVVLPRAARAHIARPTRERALDLDVDPDGRKAALLGVEEIRRRR
jgi:hypothetical protein